MPVTIPEYRAEVAAKLVVAQATVNLFTNMIRSMDAIAAHEAAVAHNPAESNLVSNLAEGLGEVYGLHPVHDLEPVNVDTSQLARWGPQVADTATLDVYNTIHSDGSTEDNRILPRLLNVGKMTFLMENTGNASLTWVVAAYSRFDLPDEEAVMVVGPLTLAAHAFSAEIKIANTALFYVVATISTAAGVPTTANITAWHSVL